MVVAPLQARVDRSAEDHLRVLQQQGYSRVWTEDGAVRIDDVKPESVLGLVIDRFSPSSAQEDPARVADSVETAFSREVGDVSSGVWVKMAV